MFQYPIVVRKNPNESFGQPNKNFLNCIKSLSVKKICACLASDVDDLAGQGVADLPSSPVLFVTLNLL